ncbi:hypothetical protein ACF0MN_10975 [Legionella pneumophila]|uniref:hypothetical protein n=1 Tax=Legionella pneumophila TaxID=446 RepID=UPI0036F4ACF3
MAGLKARIDKLYAGTISHVTSKITVSKDDKIIKQKVIGNNKEKVIEIAVRL